MARGINKVILIGNLGNDPDVRYSSSGSAIANLSVATDESYRDKQTGQMVPVSEWHKVVIFGKLAEVAKDYLRKGSKVYLEGKNKTRKWTDKEGIDRYTTEVVIDFGGSLVMLDNKEDRPQQAAQQRPAQQPTQRPTQQFAQQHADDFIDDIPF